MSTDESIRDATIQQAAQWQVRVGAGLTSAQCIEFLQWLRDNRRNIAEYLTNVQMTQLLPLVLKDVPIDGQGLAQENLPELDQANIVELDTRNRWSNRSTIGHENRKHRFSTPALFSATAMVLATLMAAYLWGPLTGSARDRIAVPHGGQRTIYLQDGSVMHLNSESRVAVRYSPGERRIDLEQGQALFKVVHDRARPFRVRAGSADVIALGTQFDVYRKARGTIVTVVEGKVEVSGVKETRPGRSERLASRPTISRIRLSAGEQATFVAGHAISEPQPASIRETTAWTRREIIANGRPLAEVAQEMSRYLDTPIRIENEVLRQMPVTILLDAYEPGPFLAFLRNLKEVEVEERAGVIHVRKRQPGTVSQ